jgi:CheY-like chemotaxis protein
MSSTTASLKILLVEDDLTDVEMVRSYLSECRGNHFFMADLSVAGDLAQAFRLLAEYLPDIILTGLGLPDARGMKVLTAIFEMAPDVPIVVHSGNDQTLLNGPIAANWQ